MNESLQILLSMPAANLASAMLCMLVCLLIVGMTVFCMFAAIGDALTTMWERRYGRQAKRMRQLRREAKVRETEHKNQLKQWAREDRAFNRAMGFK